MRSPDLWTIAREQSLMREANIAQTVYASFYCRMRKESAASAQDRPNFLATLSLANCGIGHWQTGWTLAGADGDTRIVLKDGLRFYVHRDDVRMRDETPATDGCRVRIEKEHRALIPGFYCAIGDADGSDDPHVPLLRLYWNLRAEGAAKYIALVTRACNGNGVPFRTKVISDPRGYRRADAGVLYIERTHVPAVASILDAMYEKLAPHLCDAVPMFTKRIAPGLAWAEDPGHGESFGQNRCDAIARGLAACNDGANENERYERICEAFYDARIDVDHPYLCGGAPENYDCHLVARLGYVNAN